MAATYSIKQYARLKIKGDPDAASPSDSALAPYVLSVEPAMQAKWPCTASIPASGTDADKEAYNRWIGFLVAAEFLGTTPGQTAAGATGGTTEVKLGPVTKRSQAASAVDLVKVWTSDANAARSLISCIRARFAANSTAGVMSPDLAGRRRTIGDAHTVEGDLLGVGDGVVRRRDC